MDDLYAINAAKTEFREAFNQGDACRIIAIADPDLINFPDGQPSEFGESGLESFKRRLEKLFADYTAQLSVIVIEIRSQSDVAHGYGWHDLILTPKRGGEPIHRRYRYVDIWRKNTAREWTLDVCRQRRCSGSLRAGGRPACEAKGLPRTKLFVESLAEPFRELKYPTVAH
jgi:ketosteroid isomerase-like protein